MMFCQVLQSVGCRYVSHRQLVCFASVQAVRQRRAWSSNRCRCNISKDRDQLPVIDDADVTVLPPPRTGSQYAWRHSWRGSSFSNGSGGGGRGGRSQTRPRDWGSGPGSGLIFVLMYRIRLLLLYGVWITVLYGALHAATDLIKCVVKLAAGGTMQAAHWAAGGSGSNSHGNETIMSSQEFAPAVAGDGLAVEAAAVAVDGGCGVSAPNAAAAAAVAADDHIGADVSNHQATATTVPEESFAARLSRAQDRPSAQPFTGLMSVTVPMYLMLMGSVVFFASM